MSLMQCSVLLQAVLRLEQGLLRRQTAENGSVGQSPLGLAQHPLSALHDLSAQYRTVSGKGVVKSSKGCMQQRPVRQTGEVGDRLLPSGHGELVSGA